jgi:anti-anti-sigma factor
MPSDLSLFRVEDDGRLTVRFPAGTTLSEANAEELERDLLALATSKAHPHLLVDLGGIVMLTSIILAKLQTLNTHIQALGGRLTLFNVPPIVFEVFRITRLDTVLEVYPAAKSMPV